MENATVLQHRMFPNTGHAQQNLNTVPDTSLLNIDLCIDHVLCKALWGAV